LVLHIPAARYALQLHRLPNAVAREVKTVGAITRPGADRQPALLPGFAMRDEFGWAPLYHAPMPNVYPCRDICFMNTPPVLNILVIAAAWTLFVESPFSADLASGKSLVSRRRASALAQAGPPAHVSAQRTDARELPGSQRR
jgi:hypothetical protein